MHQTRTHCVAPDKSPIEAGAIDSAITPPGSAPRRVEPPNLCQVSTWPASAHWVESTSSIAWSYCCRRTAHADDKGFPNPPHSGYARETRAGQTRKD